MSRGKSGHLLRGPLRSMSLSPFRAATKERCPLPHPLLREAGASSAGMAWVSPVTLPTLDLRPRKVPQPLEQELELREAYLLLLFGTTRPHFRSSLLRVQELAGRCWNRCQGSLMKGQLEPQLDEALRYESLASLLGQLVAQLAQTQTLVTSLLFLHASPRFPQSLFRPLWFLLSFPLLPPPSLLPFPQGFQLAGLPKWTHLEMTLQS